MNEWKRGQDGDLYRSSQSATIFLSVPGKYIGVIEEAVTDPVGTEDAAKEQLRELMQDHGLDLLRAAGCSGSVNAFDGGEIEI